MKYYQSLIILSLLVSTKILSQTETCTQNLSDPNKYTISQVVDSDTIFREFILQVPQNYDENIPTPLIINMHGFGDCATDYSKSIGDFYNFSELANEENIIVVYPQGAYRPEKEDTYWEPGDTGINNIYDNDIYFIEELIASLKNEFNINSEMIFACGYSNGGMMAYSLACNRSSLFAAIGIMSGTMLEEDCSLEKAVPIIIFHGIADGVLPYNGNVWYQSVEEVINFWLDQNNINISSRISSQLNGGNVVVDKYSEGNNSCIELYTINEEFDKAGGHVWFSDTIEGTTPNRIMWNFFKDNCLATSATKESKDELLEIFPNPVRQELVITNANKLEYSVYDINGKLILSGRIGSMSETFSLEHLSSGFYTIKIGNQIKRFFKVE